MKSKPFSTDVCRILFLLFCFTTVRYWGVLRSKKHTQPHLILHMSVQSQVPARALMIIIDCRYCFRFLLLNINQVSGFILKYFKLCYPMTYIAYFSLYTVLVLIMEARTRSCKCWHNFVHSFIICFIHGCLIIPYLLIYMSIV